MVWPSWTKSCKRWLIISAQSNASDQSENLCRLAYSLHYVPVDYFLVNAFCVQTLKALIRLDGCVGWSESSTFADDQAFFLSITTDFSRSMWFSTIWHWPQAKGLIRLHRSEPLFVTSAIYWEDLSRLSSNFILRSRRKVGASEICRRKVGKCRKFMAKSRRL